MDKGLNLKDIVLLGRTFQEYARIFSLPQMDILKNHLILDVASGVSSFCAEARQAGIRVAASDVIYGLDPQAIEAKCSSDLEDIIKQLPDVADRYAWDYFGNVDDLKECRERAYKTFIEDYAKRPEYYVKTDYPETGFMDNQFTLALVSHFLFLYEDFLDYEFHKRTILELARITNGEILIYPLANFQGGDSSFLPALLNDGDLSGLELSVRETAYRFMKTADKMLVIQTSG